METKRARELFIRGDRVEMTDEAIKQGLDGPSKRRTGIVRGFSRDGERVIVIRDGDSATYANSYHPSFWKRQTTVGM